MGRIMEFFVNFLLRSQACPEISCSLHQSLAVIRIAKEELPRTSAIAKAFPDAFSRACGACWTEGHRVLTWEEPTTVRAESDSGWGSQSAWGTPAGTLPWNDEGSDGRPESNPNQSLWNVAEQESLMALLGPTVLPLTHITGVVERSMRRIKAIIPRATDLPRPPPQPQGFYEPDMAAVEYDLKCNFVKLVLEPMPIGWDGGGVLAYSKPEVLNCRGPPSSGTLNAPKPHDPLKDEIQLLIQPELETLKHLSVGMGLGGTWVQIIRADNLVQERKKGKNKNETPLSYWYLDTLAITIPSFWATES